MLRSAALVFFGIFLVSVLLRSLPLQLADPLWQVSFVTNLIDMGGYALLGVVVLTVAHLLFPGHVALSGQIQRVTWLSRFAALGYLLLVPLLLSALLRDYDRLHNQRLRQMHQLGEAERRSVAALRSASNRAELLRAVQGFNAQALPTLQISQEPLETLRSRAQDLLARNVAAARFQFNQADPRGGLNAILLSNLRLVLLALLFAFGFSTAYTGWPSFPLLGAVILGLDWLLRLRGGER